MLIIALLMVGAAGAQGEVTATVLGPENPYSATVGDPLELTLVVTHPAGYQVIAPELGEQWGDFIIRSQSPATTAANGDGTKTTIIVLDARLFAPGEFSTPPLPVTVTDGAGQLMEVTADPAPVTITSVLVEGDTELRDIKPQTETAVYESAALAGRRLAAGPRWPAAATGSGSGARRAWRWPRWTIACRIEVALDELERIARLGLPEQKRFKEHYSMVTDTVRLYLEAHL